jgi:dipeptide transport system substrate-binding protein
MFQWRAALGFLLTLAATVSSASPAQADTLVVCTEASPDSLNAQLSTTSFDVTEQVADRLVEMKAGSSDLVPGLAESWTISPDGLSYTFRLQKGVKWQSNRSFTPTRGMNADDVVFSFRRMFDRSNPFYRSVSGNFPEFAALLAPSLLSVERADAAIVIFRLRTPMAPLLASLSMQPFSILSAEYAATLENAGRLGDLDRQLIGTGPFSFVQYQKDVLVRFRAFPDFWGASGWNPGRAAKVENLVFAITPDPAVRYAKLRTDECQIARYPNPTDLPAMRVNPDLVVTEAEITATNYIFFRTDQRPFDDPRVRRAMAMGADLENLVRAIFQGSGMRAASLVPPALWGHDDSLKPYAYDPAAAKKLLAEAGYPSGFTTELWAIPVMRAYMPNGLRAAEMLQSDWAKIGVRATIVSYEWGEYLKRIRAGEAPIGMLGATWDYPDPSEVMLDFICHAPANEPRYCSEAYDGAVGEANIVTDRDERALLYRQAQQTMYDDVPLVRVADVKAYTAIRKNVVGFRPHFLGAQPYGGVSLRK